MYTMLHFHLYAEGILLLLFELCAPFKDYCVYAPISARQIYSSLNESSQSAVYSRQSVLDRIVWGSKHANHDCYQPSNHSNKNTRQYCYMFTLICGYDYINIPCVITQQCYILCIPSYFVIMER